MAGAKNIVKYRKPRNINIGLVIFLVIIVYIAFNVFQYVTSESIAAYEVSQGAIATDNTYRGLILRKESVAYAERAGYINYYAKNAARVSVNDAVYSIDTKGNISDKISQASAGDTTLSAASIKEIAQKLDSFTNAYNSKDFSNVLAFKEDLSSTLQQMINTAALESLGDQVSLAASNSTFYLVYPEKTGLVTYYTDGYEDDSIEDFNASYMDFSGYTRNNLNTNEKVEANTPVYKLVTDEMWDVVIEISEQQAEAFAESGSVRIRFCEDNFTTNARYTVLKDQNRYFLDLRMQTAMVRYINERFVDIELAVNDQSGLKIPKSAITTKEFYTVPKEAFAQGGDSNTLGLLISKTTEDGEQVVFVTPTIYYETDDFYYIDDEDVTAGDVALINNSSKRYTIGTDKDSLIGVYNINKGYAVFKQINIMYENEDYAIVEQKTAYGISLYDHIALDGSKLTENQLITK